ncbi:DUF262 domain-containing protein [Oxalobacteraceae bacterium R-40]|uniref:DUF262 domain-containing protein n=1 Tax=Keguizhuia sedimenti TaxID=3064264 RepID=A0ABU1BK39_9BURK|nr:DUF262 domain-containing protein [Oxalobacteraceae bacterium R-40]
MSNWEYKSVATTTKEINDLFVLPVIQRRLVWDEEKIALLFDSLLKGNSFGGIMVIEEDKGDIPLFEMRDFSKDGGIEKSFVAEGKLGRNKYFVIDGQQRLQSFFIGLKGSLNGKRMYFDLFSDHEKAEFEFIFAESVEGAKKASVNNERDIKERCLCLASEIFDGLDRNSQDEDRLAKKIATNLNVVEEPLKDSIKQNIKEFRKGIFTSNSVGICKVTLDKPEDDAPDGEKSRIQINNRTRIVELFRRLNEGGTKLSAFDLMASRLKGFDYKMEAFLDEMTEKFKALNLTQDNLIKTIFVLQDDHTKELVNIAEADAKFIAANGKRIENCFSAAQKFLELSGLKNYYAGSNRSFIPIYFLIYFLFHLEEKNIENYFDNIETSNTQAKRIKDWLRVSLLNGVFKARGAGWVAYKTGVRKILAVMKVNKGRPFPVEDLFKVYRDHGLLFEDNINESTNLGLFDASFLFYIIYDGRNGLRLEDVDHIHPKNLLLNEKYDSAKINSIENFQLLYMVDNRGEKNGKSLAAWLKLLPLENISSYKTTHLIPADDRLYDPAEFPEFLRQRKTLIIDKITRVLSS